MPRKTIVSSGRKKFERGPGSTFREWLVLKVSQSRWAVYLDDTDEAVARRIGVQLDVLVDARKLHAERIAKERLPEGQKLGQRTLFGPSSARARHKLVIELPELINAEYDARCHRQLIDSSIAFRSILHRILQSPTQPLWLSERRKNGWVFRGQWLSAKYIRRERFRVMTTLSDGADLAIRTRAEKTHTSVRSICRWAICLFVADQLERLQIVTSVHAMYKRPEDYCLDPKVIA